jgi:hypothetical protein
VYEDDVFAGTVEDRLSNLEAGLTEMSTFNRYRPRANSTRISMEDLAV